MIARDGAWLVFMQTVHTEQRQTTVRKDIIQYFETLGYETTSTTPTLLFERGYLLAGWVNPNPKRQKTVVGVDIFTSEAGSTVIEATLRVNTLGNMPLVKDHEFWQAELDGLALAVNFRFIDSIISDYAADRAKWYSVAIMLGVVASTLAAMIVVILLVLMMG